MALRHDIRRGALLMLGATALFTIMSAIIKGLSDNIHFIETMFFRSAFALPVMLAIAVRVRNPALLRTRRFPAHLVRAFTGTMAQGCSFYALTVLPLAEQTAQIVAVGVNCTAPRFVEDLLHEAQRATANFYVGKIAFDRNDYNAALTALNETIRLSDFRGKKVVLYAYASW